MAAPDHILVIKLGALGDFIQALGPMAAIRKHHPKDRITILTTAPYESLAQACGYFDDVWTDKRPKWCDIKGWMHLKAALNAGDFTRVYDLQNNDRTSFYFRLFFPKPEWVGIARGASHRNNSPERTKGKAFDGHVQTLAKAGITGIEPDKLAWMGAPQNFEGLKGPYVLIIPGASPKHPQKRWPMESYAQLCKNLSAQGYQPVLIGSAEETNLTQKITAMADGCINLAGRTSLFDIPALARGAAGAIGNDTGPMHLIAPTGCPTIVLFSGKSNPARHAPMGRNVITLQKDNLADLKTDYVWKAFTAQHPA